MFAWFLLILYTFTCIGYPVQNHVCTFVEAAHVPMPCAGEHQNPINHPTTEACCKTQSKTLTENCELTTQQSDTTIHNNKADNKDCCGTDSMVILQKNPNVVSKPNFKLNIFQALVNVFRFILKALLPSANHTTCHLPNSFDYNKPPGPEKLHQLNTYII